VKALTVVVRSGEMYFGTAAQVPNQLEQQKAIARQKRFEKNRAAACA
jgi:hypothetical protein